METTPKRVVVLGVGNVLMSDEGFGVHMIEHLQAHYSFEPEVDLIDGGTCGMELMRFVGDASHLLVLDAIAGSEPPCTIYSFTFDEATNHLAQSVSAHEVGVKDLLFISSLDEESGPIKEVRIVGLQPVSVDPGIGLTPQSEEVFPEAVDAVLSVLTDWGITITPNQERN